MNRTMNVAGLLIFITIGAGAGWLAGAFMNKKHTMLVHSKGSYYYRCYGGRPFIRPAESYWLNVDCNFGHGCMLVLAATFIKAKNRS